MLGGQYVHMKRHRFKVDDLGSELISIGDRESHHAVHVLRVGLGDEILLFDGHGGEALARVESLTSEKVVARVLERREGRVVDSGLILATAIPKGERADWMIEKCAELGISRLIPLLAERSQVRPGEGKLMRWRRKVEAAAKQSGQSVLMTIEEPMTIDHMIESFKQAQKFYGDPKAEPSIMEMCGGRCRKAPWLFLIGPEGGFSDQEVSQFNDSGAMGVSLGTGTLRIETAAMAVAVLAAMGMDTGGKSDPL
jgi:16S rRNA (uracil1498-N3)-methyltransferase